ncbi:MAG: hypothetical protein KatS3mg014_2018 [Actinomycetota bacterium]|nr:MAG: hypothetical protein KatS3mg014_2018 [Actinomycetota bacterium]
MAAFRVLAGAASLATLAVVAHLARRLAPERRAFALAAFGLNPVALFQSVGSGHNDLLVALAVAGALALALAGWRVGATAALALGALVKAPAAVPLALAVVAVGVSAPRGRRLRALAPHVGVAVGLGLALAAPLPQPTGSHPRDARARDPRGLARAPRAWPAAPWMRSRAGRSASCRACSSPSRSCGRS